MSRIMQRGSLHFPAHFGWIKQEKSMSMSKKDYVALAEIIANQVCKGETRSHEDDIAKQCINDTLTIIALAIADYCKLQNAAFDRERFLAACKV